MKKKILLEVEDDFLRVLTLSNATINQFFDLCEQGFLHFSAFERLGEKNGIENSFSEFSKSFKVCYGTFDKFEKESLYALLDTYRHVRYVQGDLPL